MKPVFQDKFVKYALDGITKIERGNCFPACIASLVEVPLNQVPNIEELYDCYAWFEVLCAWLEHKGFSYEISTKEECEASNEYYMVSGQSPRGNFNHIVIYKNGTLAHDPHPDGTGLSSEVDYEYLKRIK
ncbi:hypothetical protein DBR40_24805 [Pedobacter sp. KBW01]|uniref:hypothetical protein n=1 Tax=Pedobacter sp. KBW01 TaxID=2153364 RepID=UPI000F595244|nr:hypothetical protein [Pedobacter sp. KBW01]RQO65095.1 hypothetical protein DBR40_24805 [Pedobacter sp. KBW01]